MSFEKIKSLATFYKLSNKQQKAIMLLFAGKYTQVQIAEEVQVSATTLSNWKTYEKFRQGQDEYNRFMLRDLVSEAVLTMRGLLKARSEMVRFNAAKDILDRSGNGIAEAQTRKTLAEAEIAEARAKTLKQDAGEDGQVNIIIDVPDKEDSSNG